LKAKSNTLNIYPNPSSNELTIENSIPSTQNPKGFITFWRKSGKNKKPLTFSFVSG
jgi:hypothetical protein